MNWFTFNCLSDDVRFFCGNVCGYSTWPLFHPSEPAFQYFIETLFEKCQNGKDDESAVIHCMMYYFYPFRKVYSQAEPVNLNFTYPNLEFLTATYERVTCRRRCLHNSHTMAVRRIIFFTQFIVIIILLCFLSVNTEGVDAFIFGHYCFCFLHDFFSSKIHTSDHDDEVERKGSFTRLFTIWLRKVQKVFGKGWYKGLTLFCYY